MNIFICDDDNLVCEQIKALCENYYIEHKLKRPDIYIFHSGEDILASDIKPDIVYLDIQMSGIDGIAVGNSLVKSYPAAIIIIITSFPEYLDEAMRFHVFRYLTKPIEKDRLFRNMDDAMRQYRNIQNAHRKIPVKSQDEVVMVPVSSIAFIEARDHRTYMHTREREYTTWDPLEKWASELDSEDFFQTHRSFLVNLKYVTNFSRNKVYLCDGKYQAYLTAKKYKKFSEAYGKALNNAW